ncbi:glycosyltransferase [Salinisphaera sp. C84B14]|uniref:glycosyltransferase n=1 Tax=Salinisphaera sp. C84B14 TaxID=1304155 RepID=UPI00333FE9AC
MNEHTERKLLSNGNPEAVLHCVDLDKVGGVERYLLDYLDGTTVTEPTVKQNIFMLGRKKSPPDQLKPVLESLRKRGVSAYQKKYFRGFKIPSVPSVLRDAHRRRIFEGHASGVVLFWNLLNQYEQLKTCRDEGGVSVYWERGAGWYSDFSLPDTFASLNEADYVMANSVAGAKILRARGYDRPIEVCQNGVRAAIYRRPGSVKSLPMNRTLRVGIAARLVPIKGVALSIHALALSKGRSTKYDLHIAGDGRDKQRLEELAQALGVADRVHFHGVVSDMSSFYADIDCLLHPVLSEACSNTLAEAQYCGCPVVATEVDGVPEVVAEHGGVLVPGELDSVEFARLGVYGEGLPPFVYDPADGQVCPPKAPDPGKLVDAIEAVFSDEVTYAKMSEEAIAWTSRNLKPHVKYREVMDYLHKFSVARGRAIKDLGW